MQFVYVKCCSAFSIKIIFINYPLFLMIYIKFFHLNFHMVIQLIIQLIWVRVYFQIFQYAQQ